MKENTKPRAGSEAKVGGTVAHDVYRRIRADIISGRRAPASMLKFDVLRATYNVGVSPLREALSTLANERLVVLSEFKGYRVAAFAIDELRDIARTRILVETEALRDAIRHGDDTWEAGILASLHRLQRCRAQETDASAFDEWELRHAEFHNQLIAACSSPWLLRMSELMAAHHQRYRRCIWDYSTRTRIVGARFSDQHEELARLVIDHNADAAAELLSGHYLASVNALIEHWKQRESALQSDV